MKRLFLPALLCCAAAVVFGAPRYAIGPVLWEAKAAAEVCVLRAESLAPTAGSLIPGLQPSVAWSGVVTSQPVDLSLLAIGPETIAGVNVENNCALLRGALLPALREAGLEAILRGPLGDGQRRATTNSPLPERAVAVRVLAYAETARPAAPVIALPLPVPGSVSVNLLVIVTDSATGDILLSRPVDLSFPVESRLDEANPQTRPTSPRLFVEPIAKAVAQALQELPNEAP